MIRFTQQLVSKSFSQRVAWIRILLYAATATIVLRTLFLQIIERPAWELLAERQHSQARSIKMQRGPIYDSEGNILAASLPMDSWFAIPTQIENLGDTARKLSSHLNIDQAKLKEKLSAKVSFIWLKRNTKPTDSEHIRQLELPGVYRLKEYQRFYPAGHLASHLIGFSGIDSQGLEGLEVQYNAHLMNIRGMSEGWETTNRNVGTGRFSGGSLQLTIHSRLQYMVEFELRKALAAMEARSGMAIIMESQTGAILAMANMPDFDPNNFERYVRSTYFNRIVGSVYEPGSTFKIVTVASALENGVVEENDIFFCEEGAYRIQDRTIHDITGYGWLSLEKIVQKSSNICAAKIGEMIPRPVFYKMIREFGFGRKTGIGLPGEVKGRVFDFRNWSETDVATMSFGHSISVTPIQLITAINAIASGGYLIAPFVVAEAKLPNGKNIPLHRPKKRRILKPQTAEIVKRFMASVTQKGGTGYTARVPGVSVAGKTGTSEKFNSATGEYSPDSYISSFVGFFPLDSPEVTILVVVDDPKKRYLGRKSAGIVFKKVAEQAMRYDKENSLPSRSVSAWDGVKLFGAARLPGVRLDRNRHYFEKLGKPLRNKTVRKVLLVAYRGGVAIEARGSGRLRKLNRIPSRRYQFLAEFR